MASLFECFDVPLIRRAKNREIKVTKVTSKYMWLEIDDELVKVEKTKNGILYSCSGKWCSTKGIPNKVFNCSRIMRAQWFLIQRNGRINSIEVSGGK